MDQFSSQLANNLENGYTAGVPEHLIQVYKELSAWCELIQYKIDVDINTQDDIRKQVLSNNLLKHIQGLWQEKVNEFYNIRRDEARDNLSRACQNRINNCQKMIEEEYTVHQEFVPSNEEYFNDNDSLSSEEDYFHNLNNMPSETILEDNKMVIEVKCNTEPKMNNVVENYINFDDEYEFDYGNDNYEYCNEYNNYCEYDEYDLHHYKQANDTKITLNYPTVEENNDLYDHYREFIIRPMSPSIPEWTQAYEQNNSCAADYLNNWNYETTEEKEEVIEENLSYTEQIMRQKEKEANEHLGYTEQILREQRRLSHKSHESIENDYNNIYSTKNVERVQDLEENIENNKEIPEITIDEISTQIASLTLKEEKEEEKEEECKNSHVGNNEKRRLSITIDDSVINGPYKKEKLSANQHLYPRTIESKDLFYDENEEPSSTDDSCISPNEYLLSATDEEFIYSSEKVLMTPLATEIIYSMDEDIYQLEEQEESSTSSSGLSTPEGPYPQVLPKEKISLPPMDNNDSEKDEESKEENLTKYLSSRRDSGFSETCDEPFIINV
ncbi:hypothetical protein PIROE2DRAFT_68483 [Piromyces sp. E2]|nr:hypothetical protein PIROE2DRAFT_68483 [Piromyces sp. E2]|eukprot:OUM69930.1 hypothetical protein PIROE2DRAFT_68483 [Piromyces sp. E2]